jgi:hypothetical protein
MAIDSFPSFVTDDAIDGSLALLVAVYTPGHFELDVARGGEAPTDALVALLALDAGADVPLVGETGVLR